MVGDIGWTHNIIIMSKCKDDLEQEFYIRMTKKFGWSKNVLIVKIENKTYENTIVNQTNFNETLPVNIKDQATLDVKDEYIFAVFCVGFIKNKKCCNQQHPLNCLQILFPSSVHFISHTLSLQSMVAHSLPSQVILHSISFTSDF